MTTVPTALWQLDTRHDYRAAASGKKEETIDCTQLDESGAFLGHNSYHLLSIASTALPKTSIRHPASGSRRCVHPTAVAIQPTCVAAASSHAQTEWALEEREATR